MGLFGTLREEVVDIIEWLDHTRDTLVWRFPRFRNEIKNGAQLITSAEDVLQALEPLAERPMQSGYSLDESRQLTLPVTSDDTNRNQLLNSMGYTPVTIDDLIRHTHLSADLVQLLLLELDLAGKIERHGGNLVSRI